MHGNAERAKFNNNAEKLNNNAEKLNNAKFLSEQASCGGNTARISCKQNDAEFKYKTYTYFNI
jgi:hypothetical protein